MISFLSGQPVFSGTELTLLVNGVGYEVKVGPKLSTRLQGQLQTELFIHTHVREDRLELYGFQTPAAKKLFRMFLDISGVGPQTALLITDQDPDQVVAAVQNADTPFFTALPRVGKKMAQKIIIELRTKLGEIKSLDLQPETTQETQVREALLGLGFDEQSISTIFQQVNVNELPLEQAVKESIKHFGKHE